MRYRVVKSRKSLYYESNHFFQFSAFKKPKKDNFIIFGFL